MFCFFSKLYLLNYFRVRVWFWGLRLIRCHAAISAPWNARGRVRRPAGSEQLMKHYRTTDIVPQEHTIGRLCLSQDDTSIHGLLVMVCSVASMVRDDLTTTPGLSAHPCNNICDEANTKHTHTSACTARSMQTRPETADGAQGCQDLVCKVFSGQMEHCHCAGSCIHECTLRLVCPAAPMPCCPSACPARCANLTNGGHGPPSPICCRAAVLPRCQPRCRAAVLPRCPAAPLPLCRAAPD